MRIVSWLAVCLMCFSGLKLTGQEDFNYAGARSGGMANASVTFSDMWAVFNNPAGLAGLEYQSIGVFYENRFLMPETGYGSLLYTAPLGGGNLGVSASYFGYSLFSSNKIGLAYAQKLFSNVSMGVQIDYLSHFQTDYYGNLHALTFDIGILSKPTDNFAIGFHVFNPLNLSYFSDNTFKMPVVLKFGLSYLFSKELLLALETGKSINGEVPLIKLGLEYLMTESFALRTGFSGKPFDYSFGMGYNSGDIQIDIAYTYHQILGSTPKVSVNYVF